MFKKKRTLENLYELVYQAINKERMISEQARIQEDKYMLKYMELEQEFDKLVYENKRLKNENKKLFEYLDKTAQIAAAVVAKDTKKKTKKKKDEVKFC